MDPEAPGAYAEMRASTDPCVLFESTSRGPRAAHDLLALRPRCVLVADRHGARILEAGGERPCPDPLAELRALARAAPPGAWPDEGGVAGALAYDFARPPGRHAATPLLIALAVDRFIVYEDARRIAGPPAEDPPALTASPGRTATVGARVRPPRDRLDLPSLSAVSRPDYLDLVRRVQEHIAAGDVYQANLSQRFGLAWPHGGLALYDRLRTLSPAPFAGYLRAAGIEIVSASPERLVHVDGSLATTRPIAGTRPRSPDPGRDRALARELILSEKERAEHLMLLDLARNDLGKVAAIGTVHVDEMMVVEDFAQVRHIVSNVSARLAHGRDALDALLALFPGGTITGVPKRRCMEILDALEPVPRGFYTGALFYLTRSGRLDANILIRSAVVARGSVSFHAGGGIVADSDPEAEYAETLDKAEGMRRALEAVLLGDPNAHGSGEALGEPPRLR